MKKIDKVIYKITAHYNDNGMEDKISVLQNSTYLKIGGWVDFFLKDGAYNVTIEEASTEEKKDYWEEIKDLKEDEK